MNLNFKKNNTSLKICIGFQEFQKFLLLVPKKMPPF